MAKLIALPLANPKGSTVWINPDAVSSLHEGHEGTSMLRIVGQSDVIYVQGDQPSIAAKLNSVRQREPV